MSEQTTNSQDSELGQPLFGSDLKGRATIDFTGTGLKLTFMPRPAAPGVDAKLDFLTTSLRPNPSDRVKNARLLASGLLNLYSLTKNPRQLTKHNIDSSLGVDLYAPNTNQKFIDAVRGLIEKTGHSPDDFTQVTGNTLYINWHKLSTLPDTDPLLTYLTKVAKQHNQ